MDFPSSDSNLLSRVASLLPSEQLLAAATCSVIKLIALADTVLQPPQLHFLLGLLAPARQSTISYLSPNGLNVNSKKRLAAQKNHTVVL